MVNDPLLFAYAIRKGRDGKNHWRQIGTAWPHDTGADLTLQLDLIPNPWDGRVILLEPTTDDDRHILDKAAASLTTRSRGSRHR